MTNTEKKLREQITEICLKMHRMGWVAANDGNVSAKAEDYYLVTPSGISKALVTPENIVKISQSDTKQTERASSEFKMHLRCYEERGDITAVVHAHPPTATGFAVAGKPLDGYSMIEAVLSLGSVPVTPYATPSTDEVPDSIVPFLPFHDALLLCNHGALTVGADLLTAFYRMETVEHWAKISLTARMLGGEKEIPREKIERLLELRENYGFTGKHPGYKRYS